MVTGEYHHRLVGHGATSFRFNEAVASLDDSIEVEEAR